MHAIVEICWSENAVDYMEKDSADVGFVVVTLVDGNEVGDKDVDV